MATFIFIKEKCFYDCSNIYEINFDHDTKRIINFNNALNIFYQLSVFICFVYQVGTSVIINFTVFLSRVK